MLADETGLSKSAVQSALATLHFRQLVKTSRAHSTAVPAHRVLRHWRSNRPSAVQRSDFNSQVNLPSSLTPSQATLGGAPRLGRVTQPGFKKRTPTDRLVARHMGMAMEQNVAIDCLARR